MKPRLDAPVLFALLASAVAAPDAQADGSCAPLMSQIRAAHDRFVDREPGPGTSAFPDADACEVVRTTSDPLLWCSWSFGYRADAANARFESLHASVASCLGPDAASRTDPTVNHPDSYSLHEFDAGDVTVAVSIKDKGAQKKTLVFLRIYPKSD